MKGIKEEEKEEEKKKLPSGEGRNTIQRGRKERRKEEASKVATARHLRKRQLPKLW